MFLICIVSLIACGCNNSLVGESKSVINNYPITMRVCLLSYPNKTTQPYKLEVVLINKLEFNIAFRIRGFYWEYFPENKDELVETGGDMSWSKNDFDNFTIIGSRNFQGIPNGYIFYESFNPINEISKYSNGKFNFHAYGDTFSSNISAFSATFEIKSDDLIKNQVNGDTDREINRGVRIINGEGVPRLQPPQNDPKK